MRWEAACVQEIASLCDPLIDWTSVQHCLAKNIELLSPDCVDAVVTEIQKDSWAKPRIPDHVVPDHRVPRENARWEPEAHDRSRRPRDGRDFTDEPLSAVYNEHHAGVWDKRHYEKTAINHENAHHEHHGGVHPLVFIIVFPFFCVGVYETAKKALAYYKAQRRISRFVGNMEEDYEPVKTHEIP